ncbi:hypothetical protein QWY93_07195 [Echinicola jeungdonensis]|uniref:Uncharacterized protein n=1 Tax=Echinicola jeungdonensis TaxID=709343 RepID=A0ABV5J7C8_9BACT|nr:hypothetical protein [Echinicola jeungdonensis]MDN3669109.1 hypothetical protein [Echinicola jeungdonensis]
MSIPKVNRYADGMKILDMMPMGYSEIYVWKLMTVLGEAGRDAYLYDQIPLDLVYPLLFGISYCLLLAYILKKINLYKSGAFYLSLLAPLAGLADYLENLGIINLLINYPDLTSAAIAWTQFFTLAKSILSSIYFIVLIIALVIWMLRMIRKKGFSRSKISNPNS